jgi:selenocysteine lyase/cysteine desulfurase
MQIGIRYGHFYAYTLISTLEPKLDPTDGVVRASFVHYNTIEEVNRFIETLDEILYGSQ